MPSRRLALMGCRRGPWVATLGVRAPCLKVFAQSVLKVRVLQRDGDGSEREYILDTELVSVFPLEAAIWMRVEVLEGDHKGVICEILSKRVA